jgi:uncharacterized protein (DUF2147 family)
MRRNHDRVVLRISACALSLLLATPPASASGAPAKKPAANVASAAEAGILGEWWTEKKDGRIRFLRHRDGTYMGVLTWSERPRLDTENDKPNLRNRSIVGIVLMWKLRYDDGEYEDGYVYNPEDGNTYRIDAKVIGRDTLKVRGYLGLSIFGQSQIWTRYR